MIDHCGLVWGGLHPKPWQGRCADNVLIPLDFTQLFYPGFTIDIVGCWGRALWRACNLTAYTHSLTGPVGQPFASRHEGPGFNPQGGTYVKPGFSCLHSLATKYKVNNTKEKFIRVFLTGLSIHANKGPWKSSETLPLGSPAGGSSWPVELSFRDSCLSTSNI